MMLRSGGGESRPRTSPRSAAARRRRLNQKEFRKQKSPALRSNRSARIRRAALGSASRARKKRSERVQAVPFPQ
jgi:hypothetical protein